jgi:hypothetical protein
MNRYYELKSGPEKGKEDKMLLESRNQDSQMLDPPDKDEEMTAPLAVPTRNPRASAKRPQEEQRAMASFQSEAS